jgi:SAM-dependent methyltransferase
MGISEEQKSEAIKWTLQNVQEYFSLKGVNVLEIGTLNTITAEELLKLGAESVICSNIREKVGVSESDKIKFIQLDATDTGLDPESIDFVFGRAILEHINPLDCLRDEILRILKPGGSFYLDGGPLWASAQGHHLWMKTLSGKRYNIAENCPIHNWEHLLMTEEEMICAVEARGIESLDATEIANYVYHSKDQNRILASAICHIFEGHPLLDIAVKKHVGITTPPANLLSRFNLDDLTTTKLCIAGRKKFSETEPDHLSTKVISVEKLAGSKSNINLHSMYRTMSKFVSLQLRKLRKFF